MSKNQQKQVCQYQFTHRVLFHARELMLANSCMLFIPAVGKLPSYQQRACMVMVVGIDVCMGTCRIVRA